MAALSGYTEVTGTLWVNATGVRHLLLPTLERLGGFEEIVAAPGLEQVELPLLREVTGRFDLQRPVTVTRLSAPALESAEMLVLANATFDEGWDLSSLESAGTVFFGPGCTASSITFPALRTVTDTLDVYGLTHPVEVRFPVLEEAAIIQLSVWEDPGVQVSFPALTEARGLDAFWVEGSFSMPRLHTLEGGVTLDGVYLEAASPLPALRHAGSVSLGGVRGTDTLSFLRLLQTDYIEAYENESLEQLRFPALVGVAGRVLVQDNESLRELLVGALRSTESVMLTGNTSLARLDLSGLREVDSVDVFENPSLAQCLVDDLVARVTAWGDEVSLTVRDNNEDCTCETVAGVLVSTCPAEPLP